MYIVQKPTGIYVCFCISPYRGYKTYTPNPTNKLKIKYTNAGIKNMLNTTSQKLPLYKLKQRDQEHACLIRTLCAIANYTPSNFNSLLGHCMGFERNRWLKTLAAHMSEEINQLKALAPSANLSRLARSIDAIKVTKGVRQKAIKLISIQSDLHLLQSKVIPRLTVKIKG